MVQSSWLSFEAGNSPTIGSVNLPPPLDQSIRRCRWKSEGLSLRKQAKQAPIQVRALPALIERYAKEEPSRFFMKCRHGSPDPTVPRDEPEDSYAESGPCQGMGQKTPILRASLAHTVKSTDQAVHQRGEGITHNDPTTTMLSQKVTLQPLRASLALPALLDHTDLIPRRSLKGSSLRSGFSRIVGSTYTTVTKKRAKNLRVEVGLEPHCWISQSNSTWVSNEDQNAPTVSINKATKLFNEGRAHPHHWIPHIQRYRKRAKGSSNHCMSALHWRGGSHAWHPSREVAISSWVPGDRVSGGVTRLEVFTAEHTERTRKCRHRERWIVQQNPDDNVSLGMSLGNLIGIWPMDHGSCLHHELLL